MTVTDFQAFDFVGLNTFVVENLNTSNNFQGFNSSDSDATKYDFHWFFANNTTLYTSSYLNAALAGGRSVGYAKNIFWYTFKCNY